jgi:hypothetical protein
VERVRRVRTATRRGLELAEKMFDRESIFGESVLQLEHGR